MSRYHSPRRAEAAADTRRAIIGAARDLFIAHGYTAVTVPQIAKAAQVAVQTVYSSAGGKAAILAEILAPMVHDRRVTDTLEAAAAATDPREIVDITAAGTRATHERYWDVLFGLLHNGLGEASGVKVIEEAYGEYLNALAVVADRLVKLDALRPELDGASALDILWFYLGQRSWFLLVGERGWDFERAERWLAASAKEALLKEP
ncbi:TetR family transcriptional regulator [Microbispora rosea subsp. aerata]|nr:TetR/AcrR family transcriptional regulator [Microbispora rosea]GGO05059.1 TetR family transcriptional regulator [Microbispora rosea subsp. aerata]GIH56208.1 TetR family transcriptional regulator [Microbispora rosea subsp. aerata]GLJ82352.1 TetR family transcriptional regulator [Microbispora rosea subsp. aerata]